MPSTSALKDGAVRSVPAIGGSLFLGPVLGAPIGGYTADYLSDSSARKYTVVGTGIGVAALLLGMGGGGGGGSSDRTM